MRPVATREQLEAFVQKYPIAPDTPPQTTKAVASDPEHGSFTHQLMEELFEKWAENGSGFSFSSGRTSYGPGFHVACPGAAGWPDGERHTEEGPVLSSTTVAWVSDKGHPNFACKRAHCDQGAVHGRKGWKDLVAHYDRGEQRSLLSGTPIIGKVNTSAEPTSSETAKEGIDLDSYQAHPHAAPTYPLDVWKNTPYEEFSYICQDGNYIPREFFIEAIKTIAGSVVGRNLSAQVEGGLPRFYTILMNTGGSGKGTAIKYARMVFSERWGLDTPLLWPTSVQSQEVPVATGAWRVAFSSAPGMQRVLERQQNRWLQIFEELSSQIENTKGDGYGESLLAANRQLYDGEDFTTTATAKRDACSGEAQNSILAGTTPELWDRMFANIQAEGSGLFQRYNLVVAENIKRVGTLRTPLLADFSQALIARVKELETSPLSLRLSREAAVAVDEWFAKLAAPEADGQERDPDEYGRLNVLAWRNATHLAWLRGSPSIDLQDAEKAIKLSDYQFLARKKYKPASGEHHTALLEEKIRRLVEVLGKVQEREARQKLHADRFGLGVWGNALRNLAAEGDIVRAEEKTMAGRIRKWLLRKQRT